MRELSIQIKDGWELQSDSKKLGNIIKALIRNNSCCPCQKDNPVCPCDNYLLRNICCCKLYNKPEGQGIEAQ